MFVNFNDSSNSNMTFLEAIGASRKVKMKRLQGCVSRIYVHTCLRGGMQDGQTVIEFERTIMVYKRGQAPQVKRPTPGGG